MGCRLCPRNCNVDRKRGEVGYCGALNEMVIARYSLHLWEEPCISGNCGSGTIFFSYCNLRCCFCQNYEISEEHKGRVVSIKQFCDICLELQERGACNINLVTPTHYVPLIRKGLKLAFSLGLKIPIVYNTSSYENVSTIQMLEGMVDIYLADLKYYDDFYGERYSHCAHYFDFVSKAIEEMVRQVGEVIFDDEGMMKKGVIVRHMLMPGGLEDSKKILHYLYSKYGDSIVISIMNQYTPVREVECLELNRKVFEEEYDELVNYAYDLGIRRAFIQEGDTQEESFIPDFDSFCGI